MKMIELLHKIGLHPELWMNGQHCLNGDWILRESVISSIIIFTLYVMFAATSFILSSTTERVINAKAFFRWLALVFVFCGILHIAHGLGKVNPWFYLALIPFYPLHILAMVRLAIAGHRLSKRARSLDSPQAIAQLRSELRTAQDCAKLEESKRKRAEKLILEAVFNNDLKPLKAKSDDIIQRMQ